MSNNKKNYFRINQIKNWKDIVYKLKTNTTRKINLKNEANQDNFNKKQINDIVFNEKVRLVAEFKDYLILDDNSEFLKR